MKILGVNFVPLNVSFRSRLEALAAGIWYVLFVGLIPFGIAITIYLLFFTKIWPLVCAYLLWIWVIDKDIAEIGGRPSEWVRDWMLYKYVVNYFPVTVKTVPGFQLDAKRNYLCCAFPHGYLPIGAVAAFSTYGSLEAKTRLPYHSVHGTTLRSNFFIPIYRDYLLAIGACSTTPKSLNWLLGHRDGGRMVSLFVGGVSEATLCQQGEYHLVLKNRKGFAKLALKNGAPLIPLFSFGQNRTFKVVVLREGTIGWRIQNFMKWITGFAFPVIYGRGLFQYTFGWIPFQNPINIVVGAPIEVVRSDDPTQEEIDNLHQTFIERLTDLFNQYKYEYEENPEKCSLVLC